jgi:hypothetical protein
LGLTVWTRGEVKEREERKGRGRERKGEDVQCRGWG